MTRIKICGLYRSEDVMAVNAAKPDYVGFVLDFPKSHRSVTPEQAKQLRQRLAPDICPVGVVVDQPLERVIQWLRAQVVEMIQLHGREDADYVRAVQTETGCQVIQAFQVYTAADIQRAVASPADWILLDSGQGTGETFDWSLLQHVGRDFFLAGGLTPDNIPEAIRQVHPFALDISSGVETDRVKDPEKILNAVRRTRL